MHFGVIEELDIAEVGVGLYKQKFNGKGSNRTHS